MQIVSLVFLLLLFIVFVILLVRYVYKNRLFNKKIKNSPYIELKHLPADKYKSFSNKEL